jgi:hypothetical protein
MDTLTEIKTDPNSPLEKMNSDRFSIYRSILESVDAANQKQVSVLLRWVALAFRPLTERELSSILDLQCPDCPTFPVMEIVGMTKGMLVTQDIRSDSSRSVESVVKPADQSVSGFLSVREAGEFPVAKLADTHKSILDVCLEILLEHGKSQSPDLDQHPLLQYAAKFWPKHLDQAMKSDLHKESFSNKTNDYLRRLFDAAAPDTFLCWLRLSDPVEPELGAQPEKELEDFRPMEFYIRMFNLQRFGVDGPKDSVAESQGVRDGSHHLQPSTADTQSLSAEEDRQGDRPGSHRHARHRILCCRPH